MINIIYRLKSPKFFEEAIDEVELDGVIVRPTYLSICQADQRYYQGSRPSDILSKKLPMALIHEAVGEVVYDNGKVFCPGDNVVMIPNVPLGDDGYRGNCSKLAIQSGTILGNPFAFFKELEMNIVDYRYEGTLVITWTTMVSTKNGMRTVTHTQTLHAYVTKPRPMYSIDTYLMYANDAAPNLTFS